MSEPCKHDDIILDMHGKISAILNELKAMNGKLVSTKRRFDRHEKESIYFRRKVTDMWAVLHATKWAIALLLSSTLVLRLIINWVNK